MMKIGKWLGVALAVFCAVALSSVVKGEDSQDDQCQFRVMSFNILMAPGGGAEHAWDLRKDTLVDVIKENDPLFLGVQEAMAVQMDYLNEKLEGYKSIGVGRDDGARGGECMGIFYKEAMVELLDSGTFWLSETPEKPGKGWDAACNRTVTWGKFRCKKTNKVFVYANTHLDHVGVIARSLGAKLILRKMREFTNGEEPFFLSGDFNVTEGSDAYVSITEGIDDIPGMRDANKIAKERDAAQEYTFHDFDKIPSEEGSVIDYIFVNDLVEVEKFKINPIRHSNGEMASDHCSVVATITLK